MLLLLSNGLVLFSDSGMPSSALFPTPHSMHISLNLWSSSRDLQQACCKALLVEAPESILESAQVAVPPLFHYAGVDWGCCVVECGDGVGVDIEAAPAALVILGEVKLIHRMLHFCHKALDLGVVVLVLNSCPQQVAHVIKKDYQLASPGAVGAVLEGFNDEKQHHACAL